jgi:hypothetical protein
LIGNIIAIPPVKGQKCLFNLVHEDNRQFLGAPQGANSMTGKYALAWHDDGDAMHPEIQCNQRPRGKGEVTPFSAVWLPSEVLAQNLQLDHNGVLTIQSSENISEALSRREAAEDDLPLSAVIKLKSAAPAQTSAAEGSSSLVGSAPSLPQPSVPHQAKLSRKRVAEPTMVARSAPAGTGLANVHVSNVVHSKRPRKQ